MCISFMLDKCPFYLKFLKLIILLKSANFSKQEAFQQVVFSSRISFTNGKIMQCARTQHSVSKSVYERSKFSSQVGDSTMLSIVTVAICVRVYPKGCQ